MKKLILPTFLMLSLFSNGQTNDHIQFDYDSAGNQVKRFIIDINPGKHSNQPIKNIKDLTESDLFETDIYNDIKYYPNPVKEELYVKWENHSEIYVSTIEIFSMSGQLLKKYTDLKSQTSISLDFINYPQGFYNVLLMYSSGEAKKLKIVKR